MTLAELFEEAVRYRQIANELHLFIGHNVTCTCVSTPEYLEHLEKSEVAKSKLVTREEKMLFEIFNVFEGQTIAEECGRCKIMYKFEQLIGEDAVDLEMLKRFAG